MSSSNKNKSSNKLSNYQRQQKGRAGQSTVRIQGQLERAGASNKSNSRESIQREQRRLEGDKIDSRFGFDRYKEGNERTGWLLNYLVTTIPDESGNECSGLDLYFIDHDGGQFKSTIFYRPYFFIDVKDPNRIHELMNHLQRRFETSRVTQIDKDDLDMANHLSGKKHSFLKLSFANVTDLMDAKQQLWPDIQANKKATESEEFLCDEEIDAEFNGQQKSTKLNNRDTMSFICDMREYDVPYDMRVCIDLDLRVGSWHSIKPKQGSLGCDVVRLPEMLELCEPDILAFDIECEKAPLKFPDAEKDRIYMISYMFEGKGYLIINRQIVSADIDDFEYTPQDRFPGEFQIFNEIDEAAMLRKFVEHIQELKPHITVTYNGDFFDWPYVEVRCREHNINLYRELGVRARKSGLQEAEYTGRCMVHLDAFAWVKRDSYLPQG